ncbi:MAG: hypothetical protein LBM87_09150, partial [Ruminococcus sp.]|nr:hypothetical protein [Ruminococcus sp.]
VNASSENPFWRKGFPNLSQRLLFWAACQLVKGVKGVLLFWLLSSRFCPLVAKTFILGNCSAKIKINLLR